MSLFGGQGATRLFLRGCSYTNPAELTMSSVQKVLIVGGGIAGITLA